MRIMIIILFLLTSCAARSSIIFDCPVIYKDTLKEVAAEYFMQTGVYKHTPGFYNSKTETIYLYKHAQRKVRMHEKLHNELHKAGIPLNEHHPIIWGLGY